MRRFEEVGSKIRSQRMEADTRKREREVRITDRLPPPKRPRTGGCECTLPFFISPFSTNLRLQGVYLPNPKRSSRKLEQRHLKFRKPFTIPDL